MIPVAQPTLHGREREFVLEALDQNEIAQGRHLRAFEAEWADLTRSDYALACSSGTAALILALRGIDLSPGDKVIVPGLTYIATANVVRYFGAEPVFADVDPETWTLDPECVRELIKADPSIQVVLPVHLYGNPTDMDALWDVVGTRWIIEDAAEAHGAHYRSRPVGGLGHVGCFSFFGNKTITTGEGGMLVTSKEDIWQDAKNYRDTFQGPDRYIHEGIGLNFRLSNLSAAVGLGQTYDLAWHLQERRRVAQTYAYLLKGDHRVVFQTPQKDSQPCDWMVSILVMDRDRVMRELKEKGVETRPVFPCLTNQPPYVSPFRRYLPHAEQIAATGLSLPTFSGMTDEQVETVVAALKDVL